MHQDSGWDRVEKNMEEGSAERWTMVVGKYGERAMGKSGPR